MTDHLDLDFVRKQFPALDGEWTFFDNAGGSQTLSTVVDLVREFLLGRNVQLGASYGVSQRASEAVDAGVQAIATMTGVDPGEVVFGPSTTQLLNNLAVALAPSLSPGDEVIVTDADHEANVGCWTRLAERGVEIKIWSYDRDTFRLDLGALEQLMGPRTKLVCVGHVSNILGTIHPIADIARVVHGGGAKLVVDGVAFAPHRAVDVHALDADFYVFSLYKVYAPHVAALCGKRDALEGLASAHHHFHHTVPEKLQPGHFAYEGAYSCAALVDYYEALANHHGAGDAKGRQGVIAAHQAIAAHEEVLSERLLSFLRDRKGVRIIGEASADRALRVPTISFTAARPSRDIVHGVDPHRIGIRHGHFFAKRLTDALGLDPADGVIRVSMVHYNTLEEVDRLIEVLDELL